MSIKLNSFKGFVRSLALIFSLVFPLTMLAGDPDYHHSDSVPFDNVHNPKTGDEKFNAGQVIIDHITDSHEWHLWGHTSMPLPIIVYHKERGLTCFSSARFEHGHKTYNGYKMEGKKVVAVSTLASEDAHDTPVNEELTKDVWDISITKNVFAMFISMGILLLIFLSVAKAYKRRDGLAPSGLQSFLEPIIVFVRDDIARPSIGEKRYARYMPFLLTVFFFVWINNLLGLIPIIPFGANVTGNIAVTMTLALITFVITLFTANKNYWRHVFAMPGVPIPVLFILTPVEILGVFIRPFVLMMRLFANITAGHIVILAFVSLIFIFGQQSGVVGWAVSPLSVLFVVFMSVLELLVATLQAYVFTLLSSIYFGSAIEEHHTEHH
jgi:F-type H+-transporting ATPase subunit a